MLSRRWAWSSGAFGSARTLEYIAFSCLLLSCPLGASRAWPLSGMPRGLLGFSGGISGLFGGAGSRQETPEAAGRAQRRPQGGRREVTKRLRRPTGRPQGAPRGRAERKTLHFTWLSGFAASKTVVKYVLLAPRPLQNHGLAAFFDREPRPNRHFRALQAPKPCKTQRISNRLRHSGPGPLLVEIAKPSCFTGL